MTPPNRYGARWTTADDIQLEQLFDTGLSDQEIAKAMGRISTETIKKHRCLLGLTRRRKTLWTQDNIQALYDNQSLSTDQLSAKLNIERSLIHKKRKELGLPTSTQRRWTEADIAIVKAHYATKGARYVASKLTNWTERDIQTKACALGIRRQTKPDQ